jgi:cold shock CspA family protein
VPKAFVKWYDPKHARGVVEHNGREYAVTEDAIERHARYAGAPVRFDIERTDQGDVATNVELREGKRTGHHGHRVGDTTGAHHPAEKGQDEEQQLNDLTVRRRAYHDHPRQLVEDWVAFLASEQFGKATSLYAPDASIEEGDRTYTGSGALRGWLNGTPLRGARAQGADVTGDGADGFVVRWRTLPGDDVAVRTRLRIAQGAIIEQTTSEA